MAGIHRPVDIIRRPDNGASIEDFYVQGDSDGSLFISLDVKVTTDVNYCLAATLFDDEQCQTFGGRRSGSKVWSRTIDSVPRHAGKDALKTFGLSEIVCDGAPKLWTVEDPNLYTLVLELRRESEPSQPLQVESCRGGFRTVDIVDGSLTINGKPITICGVNRHDHDPDHGKVISLDVMSRDITMIK